jgi:hypothetical protein
VSKFRKKPVVIDAVQFTGGEPNGRDLILWMTGNTATTIKRMVAGVNLDKSEAIMLRLGRHTWLAHQDEVRVSNGEICQMLDPEHVVIPTLEGEMRASVGDWIIRGVQGELYPCKPDIFAATYDVVA